MINYLFIGFGGGLGALCRYGMSVLLTPRTSSRIPLATLFVNMSGSFLLGFILGMYNDGQLSEGLFMFLGVGFCGAFTTFSTFGNETVQLLIQKKIKLALSYVSVSVVLSFIFAWLGLYIKG